ncbi:MAG TPA: hypothetical protein VH701_11185 [Vicinamibacterales bacterium]|jgi:hypothetical protein
MRSRFGLRQIIPATGLFILAGFSPFVAECLGQERRATLSSEVGDLSGSKNVEVRDAAGQAVLRGQFVVGSRRDDDNERIAALRATATNGTTAQTDTPPPSDTGRRKGNGEREGGKKGRDKGGSTVPRGQAEIETRTTYFGLGNPTQKLELSVRGLAAGATYTLIIDGKQIGSFGTTQRGRAEFSWEGPVPR